MKELFLKKGLLGREFKSTRFIMAPEKISNSRFGVQKPSSLKKGHVFQACALNDLFSLIVLYTKGISLLKVLKS